MLRQAEERSAESGRLERPGSPRLVEDRGTAAETPAEGRRVAEGPAEPQAQAHLLTCVLVQGLQKPTVRSRLPLEGAPEVKETGGEAMVLV